MLASKDCLAALSSAQKSLRRALPRPENGRAERYRTFEAWERDELIMNLVSALKDCPRVIQERMISHITQADSEYGRSVAEGIGLAMKEMSADTNGHGESGTKEMPAKTNAGKGK